MRFKHYCFLFALCVATLTNGLTDLRSSKDASAQEAEQQIELKIAPGFAPKPALKYRLYPEESSMTRGNPVLNYHRAIHSMTAISSSENFRNSKVPEYETFNEFHAEMDRSRVFTAEEIGRAKQHVERFDVSFQELKIGVRRKDVEWGLLPDEPITLAKWIGTLLPEVQECRSLARRLELKAHLEISEKRFDDALETIRVGLKLGRDLNETGYIVGGLVGVSISKIMISELQLMAADPEAPNLYWAIESLPEPFLDIRKSIRKELEFSRNGMGLETLTRPEEQNTTVEEWAAKFYRDVHQLEIVFETYESEEVAAAGEASLNNRISAFGLAMKGYPRARNMLLKRGFSEEKINAMPVVQAMAISELGSLQAITDDWTTYLHLTREHAGGGTNPLRKRPGDKLETYGEVFPIADKLLPATEAVISSELSFEQSLRALQVIEAIKLHVGETKKMPEKLSAIRIVPVPVSPLTGEEFEYRLDDGSAELKFNLHYKLHAYRLSLK